MTGGVWAVPPVPPAWLTHRPHVAINTVSGHYYTSPTFVYLIIKCPPPQATDHSYSKLEHVEASWWKGTLHYGTSQDHLCK